MGSKDRIKFPSSNQRSSQSPDQKLGIHEIKATVHKGPLPDPYTFEQYDKVVPGAADRILTKFEQQVDHRLDMQRRQAEDMQAKTAIEKEYADSETKIALYGVIFAFVISLVSIACGAYMIIATDHEILGTLFSGAGLAPLVGNFLRDTRSHHNDAKS